MTSACSRSAPMSRSRASMADLPYAAVSFGLGIEEELLLVDGESLMLSHDAPRLLAEVEGIKPDLYLALVESTTPVCADAEEGVAALNGIRERVRDAGGTVIGA